MVRRVGVVVLLAVSACTDAEPPDTETDTGSDTAVVVDGLPSVDDYDDATRLTELRETPDDLLVEAVRRRDLELLIEADQRGADLGHAILGEPMYLAAVSLDFDEGVRYFLDNGVDVNTRSRLGATAAMRAAEHNHVDLLAELIERGATLDDRLTINGEFSALLYAARFDNGTESLQLLLDSGVDVNQPGQFGDTALAVAASSGATENTSVLLDRGADVDARGNYGHTPEEAALAAGQIEAAALIAETSRG